MMRNLMHCWRYTYAFEKWHAFNLISTILLFFPLQNIYSSLTAYFVTGAAKWYSEVDPDIFDPVSLPSCLSRSAHIWNFKAVMYSATLTRMGNAHQLKVSADLLL